MERVLEDFMVYSQEMGFCLGLFKKKTHTMLPTNLNYGSKYYYENYVTQGKFLLEHAYDSQEYCNIL